MKKDLISRSIFAAAFLVAATAFGGFNAETRADDPEPKTVTEKIELLNGENLDGWYTYLNGLGRDQDPNGVFSVQDGVLHISGNGWGCVTTKEAYRNYRLIVEYKWGEKTWGSREKNARDSGVLLHSVGEDGAYGGSWAYSIEVNVIEGGVGDFIVVGDGGKTDRFQLTAEVGPEKSKTGSLVWKEGGTPTTVKATRIDWFGRDPDWKDVVNFRGKNDVEKPRGEWNRLEVVADGDKLDVYLNDVLVNRAFDVKPCGGRIQLQTEMAEIFYRRATLLPLEK